MSKPQPQKSRFWRREPEGVVWLEGTSFREEDWEAIRRLTSERKRPAAGARAVAEPEHRDRSPDRFLSTQPLFPPRPSLSVIAGRPAYLRYVVIGGVLTLALALSAYLGYLLGSAIYPR